MAMKSEQRWGYGCHLAAYPCSKIGFQKILSHFLWWGPDDQREGYRSSGLWCMQDYVIIMSLFWSYCACAKWVSILVPHSTRRCPSGCKRSALIWPVQSLRHHKDAKMQSDEDAHKCRGSVTCSCWLAHSSHLLPGIVLCACDMKVWV